MALLPARNEERFVANCLEHLIGQGIEPYLIDNESEDATVTIAERYLGRGLRGIETLPFDGVVRLHAILRRVEEVAGRVDADWAYLAGVDEVLLPPRPFASLAEAFAATGAAGHNAVNFFEFTFVPTRESPDHDHPDYLRTMRWYYPFAPRPQHRVCAWRQDAGPPELASSGGHLVRLTRASVAPESFPFRHYLLLSVEHAVRKYGSRRHDPAALALGWHGWREGFRAERVRLPFERELRLWTSDDRLDPSNAAKTHLVLNAPGNEAGG